MWMQKMPDEREDRRSDGYSTGSVAGCAVKNCMTVIVFDGGLSKVRKICRFPMETAFSIL